MEQLSSVGTAAREFSKEHGPVVENVYGPSPMRATSSSRREAMAERVLGIVNVNRELHGLIGERAQFFPEEHRLAYETLRGVIQPSQKVKELLDVISLRSSFELDQFGSEKVAEEFEQLLRGLELEYLRERQREVARAVTEAEAAGTEGELLEKLKEFDDIARRMQDIQNGKKDENEN